MVLLANIRAGSVLLRQQMECGTAVCVQVKQDFITTCVLDLNTKYLNWDLWSLLRRSFKALQLFM